jgi:hypothetical protein
LINITEPASQVLLLASRCEPLSNLTVWAIGIDGKRLATPDEIAYFNRYIDCGKRETCAQNHSDLFFPRIKTERVVGDNPAEWYGRFYENNKERYYLYLNDQLIVVTKPRKLALRFDRTLTTASQVAAAVTGQIDVRDLSLAEPDLASIVKQIYNGALQEEAA